MDDRFKFKHWDKEINEMRYGDIHLGSHGKPFVIGKNSDNDIPKVYDIDDVITLQCTGLKDKNGKLIFDLDLLEYKNEIWKVTIDIYSGVILISVKGLVSLVIDDVILFNSKIIGNIYENPELLEC